MKLLVIGSGGREHALVWKLAQSPHTTQMWCAPGNAGIAQERLAKNSSAVENVAIGAEDLPKLLAFAKENRVDLTVVGPDNPLALGIVDLFQENGLRIWGVNQPVAWAFALTNFVWWVGIGHAGTFISAFLLLLRQHWRTSINRFAEAMTIFAVAMAGLMPILHLGRPWFFYWLIPYPDVMNVWPQWRSPLVWDIFAIATYIIVSILFWYMGLIPDLATTAPLARGAPVGPLVHRRRSGLASSPIQRGPTARPVRLDRPHRPRRRRR